ncbi:MAG: hypothetical protein ABFR90_01665 [Planctomycetota bacterium]
MHLVKWLRRNMQQVMVFVVIAIMVAFVLGSGVRYIFDSIFNPMKTVVATYDDGTKIKREDYRASQNELKVLRMLMADQLLIQSQSGMTGPLLVYLLFPDSQFSGDIASQMKQAIQQGQLPVSQTELDDFFQQRPESPEILWILLKSEAKQAGCIVSTNKASETLRYAIPGMTKNQLDAGMLVRQIIKSSNISQEQIVRTFSDLLGVLTYTSSVMDQQAVTINQVKASLGRSKERIDAEFVKIAAEPLVDKDTDVTDAQIQQHFDKYKAHVPGDSSEDNPFGFGYQLPKRIQLEYMIVLLDDVKKKIEKPTAEDLEDHYAQNISMYQTSEPVDPNNPESEQIPKRRSFAEVEARIRSTLETEKTQIRANILFNEIKDKTEEEFEEINFDEATAEQLQKVAGEFDVIGAELAQKNDIPIATGKTGWLDMDAFSRDKILNTLGVRRGQQYLRLSDMAFAATEEKELRRRIGVPSVRTWQNLGPFSGGYFSEEESQYVQLMALVRVVGIQDAGTADSVDVTFETLGVVLDPQEAAEQTSFSVKDTVKDDILLMKAMETANSRGEELAAMIADANWIDAIDAYNEKYAATEADPDETEDAEVDGQKIELETIEQQLRMSQANIQKAKSMMLDNPGMASRIRPWLTGNMLINQLYTMLDEDNETTGTIQKPLPFEPEAACYVIKEVVRQPATTKDYLDNKAQAALQLSMSESAGLALVHLSPENILERMGYELKLKQEPAEEEAPSEEVPPSSDEESE